MRNLLKNLKQGLILGAIACLCYSCGFAANLGYNPWQQVPLPTESTLQDVAFSSDLKHGWIVGSDSTLLETTDGGNSWQSRQLPLGEQKYRLNSVSFQGQEGWISGEPAILLHSIDDGKTWSRVPLSEKLPGEPTLIKALGAESAEMATNVGAIYRTEDSGNHWKAMVQEAVGVVRNIYRNEDGRYVAVSSRGTFYSTWEPGESAWKQHLRDSSQRLQNMGYGKDGRLWSLARGGKIEFSHFDDLEVFDEPIYPEFATNWGLLDMAYRTPKEIWLSGGSGNLLCSLDGGKTWMKDREIENVPSNLYRIVFFSPEQGFILGQKGVLLKYTQPIETALVSN
ncbi:MAG: photosynthesis system II assembly factor Ycf48 [Coleofasciculaceae cyanobacterium SM2_1_6]|nr:photosynthesis system II assembly factor Ycf48 [Coleofasciculaceae cyanobacterium SM2_1_6]